MLERRYTMNFIKNILFTIIIMQIIVLIEVLFLTNRINLDFFNKRATPTPVSTPAPVSIKNAVLSQEEEQGLFQVIKNTKKGVFSYLSKNSNLEFLYSKEVHDKMTGAIVSYAKKFLGTPYVWGAIGPNKFDCSGFTQKVYRQLGINIPRYSGHQAEVGTLIKYENLQRGDMVFFDTERKATGRVNHVGIYLGDGKFIHASSGKKKVVITNFNEKLFYKNRFLWGRRVIQNKIFKTLPSISLNNVGSFVGKLI